MSKLTVYDMITQQILDRLEQGVVPWKMPWDPSIGLPRNIRGNVYRGVNVLMLQMVAAEKGYKSNTWLTFTQVKDLGGTVIKGEQSTPVVFWKIVDKRPEAGEITDPENPEKIFLLRYYRVFNIAQTEGIPQEEIPKLTTVTLASAEDIIAGYVSPPTINSGGPRACYVPSHDLIRMPVTWSFESMEEYYATLFHELVHSTGHESRLARAGVTSHSVTQKEYSKEELVAEIGSSYLCHMCGISPTVIDNQAAYIGSWMKALKGDPGMVVTAAAAAQKAVDRILGVNEEKDKEKD